MVVQPRVQVRKQDAAIVELIDVDLNEYRRGGAHQAFRALEALQFVALKVDVDEVCGVETVGHGDLIQGSQDVRLLLNHDHLRRCLPMGAHRQHRRRHRIEIGHVKRNLSARLGAQHSLRDNVAVWFDNGPQPIDEVGVAFHPEDILGARAGIRQGLLTKVRTGVHHAIDTYVVTADQVTEGDEHRHTLQAARHPSVRRRVNPICHTLPRCDRPFRSRRCARIRSEIDSPPRSTDNQSDRQSCSETSAPLAGWATSSGRLRPQWDWRRAGGALLDSMSGHIVTISRCPTNALRNRPRRTCRPPP